MSSPSPSSPVYVREPISYPHWSFWYAGVYGCASIMSKKVNGFC